MIHQTTNKQTEYIPDLYTMKPMSANVMTIISH